MFNNTTSMSHLKITIKSLNILDLIDAKLPGLGLLSSTAEISGLPDYQTPD